jgi:opacity protein-like surface antigen
MRSVKNKFFAGTAAIAISIGAASAADLPPPVIYEPLPVKAFSGWYLRGDIGMTNQQVKNLDNLLFPNTPNLVIHDKTFDSGMLFGLGVGYQYNSWLRFDVTGEYRGKTNFSGLDTWNDGTARFNNYTGKKSEWLFLANAYLDLGTWWCITPFIGAGIGTSRNTIHSFRDAGIDEFNAPTLGYADAASKWNFAWAVHAGLSYQAAPNLTFELAYRYLSLGDAQSGDIIAYDGTNNFNNPMRFNDITSHDIKFGMRWALDGGIGKAPVPQYVAPPPPQYVPAPVQKYTPIEQPPLMRRG